MPSKIIVDAYNVLFKHPEWRRHVHGSLELARMEMARGIVSFSQRKKMPVTLVFDGRGHFSDQSSAIGKVKIVFSKPPQNADTFIKRIIDKHSQPQNLIIVSSDHEVAGYARLNKCAAWTAEQFLASIEDLRMNGHDPENFQDSYSVEEWLHIFKKGRKQLEDDK